MDTKRGEDAEDRAPRPGEMPAKPTPEKSDTNTKSEHLDDRSIEVEDLSSANDEGAN